MKDFDHLARTSGTTGTDAESTSRFFATSDALSALFDGRSVFQTNMAILFELYRAERAGRLLTVSGIGLEFAIPQATMLRHLRDLTDRGLVMRSPHAKDRRISYVRLTPGTLRRLETVLAG